MKVDSEEWSNNIAARSKQREAWLTKHGDTLHEIYFTRIGMAIEGEELLSGLPK